MGDLQGRGVKNQQPVHTVRIEKPFAIGRYEVTFEEYERFAKVEGRKPPYDKGWGRHRRPVIYVTWKDAWAYAQWLSAETGERYRLPTEAEWEYAARANSETAFWWGEILIEGMANCSECGGGWEEREKTAPVGSFKPNQFGLYDTAGNVWEWLEDCWHKNYDGAPADGSAWLEAGSGDCGWRVIRGGSWDLGSVALRSSVRARDDAVVPRSNIGFRVARDIQ